MCFFYLSSDVHLIHSYASQSMALVQNFRHVMCKICRCYPTQCNYKIQLPNKNLGQSLQQCFNGRKKAKVFFLQKRNLFFEICVKGHFSYFSANFCMTPIPHNFSESMPDLKATDICPIISLCYVALCSKIQSNFCEKIPSF